MGERSKYPLIRLDQTLECADWIKIGTWDGPEDEAELRRRLRAGGMTWEDFQKLPSYQAWKARKRKPTGGGKND